MAGKRGAIYHDVHVIEAGTMGGAYADEATTSSSAVVAVIELTQRELEHLSRVCGHDGFGMLPEAADEILAKQKTDGA